MPRKDDTKATAEEIAEHFASEEGWSDRTLTLLLFDFIDEVGMATDLGEYLVERSAPRFPRIG